MLVGAAIVAIGALVRFAPGLFSWFGNLPGDIRIEGENTRLYIPITSMIVASAVISLVLYVVNAFRRG
ncbi:MAG: DUF2905 domain-containing protein [Actinobacteria bacterium]|nr:MAG: DUF2905 domain-containing protein [Actinomycetota bacterium]REK40476.1 MAG: DUF2905 domain-containing protein [Actinomycetota bacterium]